MPHKTLVGQSGPPTSNAHLAIDSPGSESTRRVVRMSLPPPTSNYAKSLRALKRFEEAKSLLRKTMPVARRVLGESHEITLRMRTVYAQSLYLDANAKLDDLHEAVNTLEDAGRIARRVFGGAHPRTVGIEAALRNARAALSARETPPSSSSSGDV